MPKHKKWIDKKHSKTFRLIHQNQNANNCDDEHVQQSTGKKLDVGEYHRYGIYFDDDYDYLQHLKEVNEITENEMERSVIRVPSGKTNLLTNIFEVNGYEINGELLKRGTLSGKMHIDPYVIAELTDDYDIEENPTDDLEDDFVLQASGGELPALPPPVSFSLRENEFCEKLINNDDDSDEDMELDSNCDNDQMSEEDVFVPMKNKEKPLPIDEKFDKLCQEYNEVNDGETNENEEKLLLDPNSVGMKMLAEDFKNKRMELVLQKDVSARRYVEINDEALRINEEVEKITIVCPKGKKAKLDCETIVSAYSNIYNRPALIDDFSHKRKLKSVLKQLEKMDCSSQSTTKSVISKVSSATIRKRGETAEERKTRKAAIKMIRAERRAEKKCNKLAFKEERKKATAWCRGYAIKMIPIA